MDVGDGSWAWLNGRHDVRRAAVAVGMVATLLALPVGAGAGTQGDEGSPRQPAAVDVELVSDGPPAVHGLDRFPGADRIETAVLVSTNARGSASTVVLARADVYADALAGAPLAARLDAPVLLTRSSELSDATADEIVRLGATSAVLLGGQAALSDDVVDALGALGVGDVTRHAGADRFATAALIADELGGTSVYVTEGANADPARGWPDAVSVSGLAAQQQRPLLLVTRDRVPAATRAAMQDLDVEDVTIVGGPAAVSGTVADALAEEATVGRVFGDDRYATAAAVAQRALADGSSASDMWVVTGRNFPDSLVAGPAAAAADGILLLVHGETLDRSVAAREFVNGQAHDLRRIHLVGGTAAISQEVEDEFRGFDTDPLSHALDDLRDESTTPPEIVLDEDGQPTFVDVTVPFGDEEDTPVDHAFAYLERFADAYGIEDPVATLHLRDLGDADDGTDHLVLGQHGPDGIPVLSSEIAVHMTDDAITGTNGTWLPRIPELADGWQSLAQHPGVSEATALAEVEGADRVVGAAALRWFNPTLYGHGADSTRLVHEVHVSAGVDAWQVLVDVFDGTVLRSRPLGEDRAMDYTVKDRGNAGVPGGDPCMVFATAPDRYTEDGPVDGYTPGSDAEADALDAGMRSTHAYFDDRFGWDGWEGGGGHMRAYSNVNLGGLNATYVPFCNYIRFSPGMATTDVTAHEFTHGLDEYARGLNYENESGALDESYADIFGALVEFTTGEGDWTIGERSSLGMLRSLEDPPLRGDPDRYSDVLTLPPGDSAGMSNDFGFVHSNSGIPNKAAYLIAEGTEPGAPFNDFEVDGIGRDKLALLYHRTQTREVTSNSTMLHQGLVSVDVARDWSLDGTHGFRRSDVCSVRNAFAAVEILPTGDRDCDGTLDDTDTDQDNDSRRNDLDNCPGVFNPGQLDTDGDGAGDACDDDDDNDGVLDGVDNCRVIVNAAQVDSDGDGVGDLCQDDDGDSWVDLVDDNCPGAYNPGQVDLDGDGRGDPCDTDDDGDGVSDGGDNCPRVRNADQFDSDGDGVGSVCDNCPATSNPGQSDIDGDGSGDACDDDRDGDGLANADDSCPDDHDPYDIDIDGNGLGLVCDESENQHLDGSEDLGAIHGGVIVDDFLGVMRIPISPCLVAVSCPTTMDPAAFTNLTIDVDGGLGAQVVDARGFVIARLGDGDVGSIEFSPEPTYAFTSPGGTLFSDGGYFLEVIPRPDSNTKFELTIDVDSGFPAP